VRANREKACLSSCLSWLMRQPGATTMMVNPCMQASGTQGNAESKRERYVTDEEYRAVCRRRHAGAPADGPDLPHAAAPESDILGWTPTILTRDEHTKARILHFQQGKTKVWVKIALTPDLDALIRRAMGEPPRIDQPLVHNRKGERYTYTGIMAMLTAAIKKANRRAGRGHDPQLRLPGPEGQGRDRHVEVRRADRAHPAAVRPRRQGDDREVHQGALERGRGAERSGDEIASHIQWFYPERFRGSGRAARLLYVTPTDEMSTGAAWRGVQARDS
jgi:hypothetical protein